MQPTSADFSNTLQFVVQWQKLSFDVKVSTLDKLLHKVQGHGSVPNAKRILDQVCGQFSSGQLMAMMGPSGSGKSTLLKCICKRKFSGRTGNITVTIRNDVHINTDLRFAFIPQHDSLFEELTVKESVRFAAKLHEESMKLKKWMPTGRQLDQVVDQSLDTLGLTVCAENKVGVCSGGQQKRLSIAQELVRSPNVLILDEPTSGLDSSTCEQLVKYLRELADSQKSMAIVATIHQPSFKVLSNFDSLYILSRNGNCIYSGPPQDLVSYLSKYELFCPQFYNPADYALEVASGIYGALALQKLEVGQRNNLENVRNTLKGIDEAEQEVSKKVQAMSESEGDLVRPLVDLLKEPKHPLISHSMIIAGRSFWTTCRDSWGTGIRFGTHLIFGLVSGFLYQNMGVADGCPIRPSDKFDPSDLEIIQNATKAQTNVLIDNCGNLVGNLLLIVYVGLISTALIFPSEMATLIKERSNGWYTIGSYFLGKTLADIPFQIVYPLITGIPSYFLQRQIPELFRFTGLMIVHILVSMITQSQGLLVGSLFVSAAGAAYMAPVTAAPFFVFNGFIIQKSSLPLIHLPANYASLIYHGFQASLSFIYGFDRCGQDVRQKTLALQGSMMDWFSEAFGIVSDLGGETSGNTTESSSVSGSGITTGFVNSVTKIVAGDYIREDGEVKSFPLLLFEVIDETYWINILVLIILLFTVRFITFLVIRFQVNRRQ